MLPEKSFLLTSEFAKKLYFDHARKMPIFDYHCHLDPRQIYENRRFENLTQVWLNDHGAGDHYKWRLMRANGTSERYITGDGDDKIKFLEFVKAMEKAPGNPVLEWSQLELSRVFDIDLAINQRNAEEIWNAANQVIAGPSFSARELIKRFNVRCLCTTDDPASALGYHALLRSDEARNGFKVAPTFRPDALMSIDLAGFSDYLQTLSDASGVKIHDLESLEHAAAQRIDAFQRAGGRLADHGMNSFRFLSMDRSKIDSVLVRRMKGDEITEEEMWAYRTHMTLFLMQLYSSHAWTMQIHMNCFRNVSSTNYKAVGADAGFDCVGDQPDIVNQIRALLDAGERQGDLPRLILYSLNARDWLALAALAGSFEGGCAQRIHFGCAWWFNDTYSGMKRQITTYAEQSLLGNFTGMLTDSRSFLSYPRHEYFRRVLCDVLGGWVECDRLPRDEDYLGGIVEDISYNNANDSFHL
ncbi:D-glucuronate isomerase [Coriobacterium glomerans PW2]|uniref:Uronate isomerase n=1 Tax=Coriobacterium glomerans (strain ATCC 49209 / DSM 20642 / JCM 10262 / PW2) TaxID=700015 RepID=F2NBD4_CORGP|nr:glucuronate isomerase [Coriobacterium glomerans]AEB06670.1 D-glucuronate isomerase [Coriobacterium glomerans PW2]